MDHTPQPSFPPEWTLQATAGPGPPPSSSSSSLSSSSSSSSSSFSEGSAPVPHPPEPPAVTVNIDSHRAPGYQQVVQLAECLVERCKGGYIYDSGVEEIVKLWENLDEVDKAHVKYPPGYKVVEDFYKRRILTPRDGGTWPDASRLVEAIFVRLCVLHQSSSIRERGRLIPRLTLVLRDYRIIRDAVLSNPRVMSRTTLQLFFVSKTTMSEWHQRWVNNQERNFLSPFIHNMQETGTAAAATANSTSAPSNPAASSTSAVSSSSFIPAASSTPAPSSNPAAAFTSAAPSTPTPSFTPVASSTQVASPSPAAASTPAPSFILAAFSTSALSIPAASNSAAPSTQAPSPASAAPSTPTPSFTPAASSIPPPWSRSTAYRRRLREKEQLLALERGVTLIRRRRMTESYTCKQCGQPKTREFGHTQYKGEHFCSKAQGRIAEEWLEEKKRQHQNS